MGKRKIKRNDSEKSNMKNSYLNGDPDFGGLENITEKWYKENRE